MKISKDDYKKIIVDKSSIYFSKYGIYKTTIDDIARALNMGKSSLYYYFKSKDDIFKAVLDKEVESFGQKIRDAVNNASGLKEKLKAFGATRTKCLKELKNKFPALKESYLTDYAFFEDMRKEYDVREINLMKSILQQGVDQGEFVINDIELSARTIVSVLKGIEYEWTIKENKPDTEIESSIDALMNIFLNGIAKKH
jgi:AcrR family transcriptional regulator